MNIPHSWTRYSLAIADAKAAIEIDPKYSSPYGQLANTYLLMGKLKEAEEVARKAIEASPHAARCYFVLGTVLEQMQNFKGALANYSKFLELGHANLKLVDEAKAHVEKLKTLSTLAKIMQKIGSREKINTM